MSSLFLKYRPQTFSDIVGQTSVVKTLKNALRAEQPSHAYLFSGSRGTGKTSMARIFAKGLTCEKLKDGNPCGQCDMCIDIAEGNLVDVIEIDAASNRGIDEIRDLREKILFSPNRAKRKVYIIDEVHMLTKEAFNALLKTLEEPPEHAYFLLATTEMHKLPETIISRCQTFIFNRFGLDQLVERLELISKTEKFSVEEEAFQLIARKAEGGLRDAISLLEQISAETENNITTNAVRDSLGISTTETLEQFWNAIEEKDSEAGLAVLKEISSAGKDFRTFGHDFLGFLRDKLHQNLTDGEYITKLLPAINQIESALAQLKTSPIVELPLEIAVVNLCQGIASVKPIEKRVVTAPPTTTSVAPTPVTKVVQPVEKKEESTGDGFLFDEMPKVERKPQKIEEPIVREKIKISIDTILSKMAEIAEQAKIPAFAKMSFLDTKPIMRNGKIIFETESSFHREKLDSEVIRNSVQNTMIEMFGESLLIDFSIVDKAEVKEESVATADDFLNF
jgi:DNA polymerase III subunit gamma/tau